MPNRVQPTKVETDPFAFPLDSSVTIRTAEIEIPNLADLMIRNLDGEYLGQYSTASAFRRLRSPRSNHLLDP